MAPATAGGSRLANFSLGEEQNVNHQLDDFTWGEMIASLGGVGLGELADELFEHVAHVVAGDHIRVQIDGGKLFHD